MATPSFSFFAIMAQRMQNTSRHEFANYGYFLFTVVLRSF